MAWYQKAQDEGPAFSLHSQRLLFSAQVQVKALRRVSIPSFIPAKICKASSNAKNAVFKAFDPVL